MNRGLHPAAVAATSDEARRSRPLAVRMFMASPRLALRIGVLLAKSLPLRPKAAYLRWLARLTFDAFSRRDWEVNTLSLDATDYEFRVGTAGQLLPDMRERYSGVEGYLEAMLGVVEVFPDLSVETERVGLHGASRLVAILRWKGTAAGSGVGIDQRLMTVVDFPRGRISRQWYWFDPDTGLRELGLTPPRR